MGHGITMRARDAAVMVSLMLIAATGQTLAAPATAWYDVRRGDNLSVIAERFGESVSRLKRDNDLERDIIHVGQRLRLGDPFRRTSGRDVHFRRPFTTKGRILEAFGPRKQGKLLLPHSGVMMAYPVGGDVFCPAPAIVRYLGQMDEYGTLVILEHGGGYHSVFAPLDPADLACSVGQALLPGDRIGSTGPPPRPDQAPHLHIELRKDEKAVDPGPLIR
jgi:LysM repeat protein